MTNLQLPDTGYTWEEFVARMDERIVEERLQFLKTRKVVLDKLMEAVEDIPGSQDTTNGGTEIWVHIDGMPLVITVERI